VHALQAAFDKARTGKGQIRLVTGEAGQGKSMLLEAFARRLYEKDAGLRFARGYCNAITGFSDPFLPFREILVMLTGDESAWAKQIKALTGQFGAEINQVQIFAQYAAALKAIAENRPLLLVVEDLHWIDVASSSLLFHLSRELTNSRILLVGTYRPEEVLSGHPMSGILSEMKRTYGDIWFDLGQQTILDKRRFIDAYLDTEPNHLGEKFRIALLERTSGHPLFTAELLRSMQDRGEIRQDENGAWVEGTAIKWKTLPAKVEGVIEKRIERLDEELQSILTTASVEGAVFTAEVVARIQRIEERPLVLQLSRELDKRHQLVEAQEVKWLDAGQQRLSTYRFRHNLFQNYLYHHLDEVERGYLHEAVGKTLENIYQITDEIAGQLAYHFQQAGLNAKAISYAEQACDSAANVHAYDEAVVHIKRAVDLAEKTGTGAEILARLSIRLGGLLLIIKGDGAPEVGLAYQQAYDLAKDSGQIRMQFEALRGLALFQRHRMEMEIAHKLTIEMCDLSQQLQDSALIIEASFALGSQSFFSGDHEEAEINLARSIATYNPKEHQSLANRHGQDPGVASLAYAAINAWMLGYPDRARDHYTRAIKLASEIDHAYSLTRARNWAAWTSVFLREPDNVLEHAQAAIRLAEKHNFPLFQAIGTCHCGWALAQRGEKEEAIRMMEQGLADAVVAWGSALGAPPFLALLAEMYGRFGQPNEGLETLKNAFVLIDQIEGHSWAEPELYRLRGLLSQSAEKPESEIEADLQQAINIARSQSARSLELRSTGDLARFWQRQRKPEQGREILSACYSWFTEGFDTVDLQEAQSFLNTLS
jgi:predicted ATPase